MISPLFTLILIYSLTTSYCSACCEYINSLGLLALTLILNPGLGNIFLSKSGKPHFFQKNMPQLVTKRHVSLVHTHNLAIYRHGGRGQLESDYIHICLVYLDPR